jgi:hypothetical protein
MHASTRLYLVERPPAPASGFASAVLRRCFDGLCVALRSAAELYGSADAGAARETPQWLLGAGQVAPVAAGRWPLNEN